MFRKEPALTDVPPGTQVRVRRLGGPRSLWLRMVGIGLHPGAKVRVEEVNALAGTVEVDVRGSRVSLPREDAAMVFVKIAGPPVSHE